MMGPLRRTIRLPGKAGYRPEIYALGIRNALGLVFHPRTGELWETENGPQGGDSWCVDGSSTPSLEERGSWSVN
jgi:glucose/arabinose dehydrogenase